MSNAAPFDALAGIAGKLADLTDEKLLEVLDRLAAIPTSSVVPPLLDEVRPRLRRLRPARPLSLLRLLCRPFEDLLSDAVPLPPDRVPRSVIEPSWRLLIGCDAARYGDFKAELDRLTPTEPEKIAALAERLWRWAASVYAFLIEKGDTRAYLKLMRDTLEAGPVIEAFKCAVPGCPVAHLGAFEAPHVEAGLRQLASQGLSADAYLMVVAARLANPGELLAVRSAAGSLANEATTARLAVFAMVEIEERSNVFAGAAAEATPNDLARDADQLTQSIALARRSLDGTLRARLEQRMQPVMTVVRDALRDRIIAPAPLIATAALMPDGSDASIVAAEGHARALGRARNAAALVGLETQIDAAVGGLRRRFEVHVGDEVRRAVTIPSAKPAAERAAYRSIRFIELIDGPQRARELYAETRRRLRPRPPAAVNGR
jgi:hypothetical protein